jgi:hypothetical protein
VILLETERLRLRRFEPADIDWLVELDSDPEVMRYITYGQPTPRERYEREIIPRWLAFQETMPLLGYWAAESRAGLRLPENGRSDVLDDVEIFEHARPVHVGRGQVGPRAGGHPRPGGRGPRGARAPASLLDAQRLPLMPGRPEKKASACLAICSCIWVNTLRL